MSKPKLIIFDFDGTILHNLDFYRNIYSKSLDELILKEKGEEGLAILQMCRENFYGKGELALCALNIPFSKWADMLSKISLDLVNPDEKLIEQLRKINAVKVIYSGSPIEMVKRALLKLGFLEQDFDLIVAWKEPEAFPVKWTSSPVIFEKILLQFNCKPEQCLAIGDDWESDLLPARTIGIKTIQIGTKKGTPDARYETLKKFLKTKN